MPPITPGRYEYRHQSLVELRTQLKLKQSEMAELLGVPANTLSRWETGATTPDAESLAKFYSIAMEQGEAPAFFQRRRPKPKATKERTRLLVMWDFQNSGVGAKGVPPLVTRIKDQLDKRFATASQRRFKAFSGQNQTAATDELMQSGWRVWEDDEDMDRELIAQAKSDCGQEPKDTIFVLVTCDGDYGNLVADLQKQGVQVHLLAPNDNPSERLVKSVGEDHVVQLSGNTGQRNR